MSKGMETFHAKDILIILVTLKAARGQYTIAACHRESWRGGYTDKTRTSRIDSVKKGTRDIKTIDPIM
jgi:hypothetical protein